MAIDRDITHISHHTKIVATLGPASDSPEMLESLIKLGLNVFRFNFSHSDAKTHAENAKKVREASQRAGREVAIVADLQGPKIRVGKIKDKQVQLTEGQTLILDASFKEEGDAQRVGLDYEDLPKDVSTGDILLLDDGLITLEVIKVQDSEVHTKVLNSAVLKSNKGINKRGGGLSAPALTEKDIRDLKTALEIGADYIAVSFVKSASDMDLARQLVVQNAQGNRPGLIAKIERVEAIENLERIIKASDGIMVARGDLAVEVGNAAVPALQKRIIRTAKNMRRFVITATQMMESMINNPVPTRAEVSDVANAVIDGTDAVMLSAESAAGKYPYETVKAMAEICRASESMQTDFADHIHLRVSPNNRIDQAIAEGAVYLAQKLQAKAIIALTESGTTPLQISRHFTNTPIYALTANINVQRKMAIYRGVRPLMLDTSKNHDKAIAEVEDYLQYRNILSSGDLYVITSGQHMGQEGATNMLQIYRAK